MPKKTFKGNAAHLDRFFTDNEEQGTANNQIPEPYNTQNTSNTQYTPNTQGTSGTQKTYYRINLKLRPEFRQYLDDESWKARKSITEYLNDLIAADMAAKQVGTEV